MAKYRDLKIEDGRVGLKVARENGVSLTAFRNRIRLGWSVDSAASTPMAHRQAKIVRDNPPSQKNEVAKKN